MCLTSELKWRWTFLSVVSPYISKFPKFQIFCNERTCALCMIEWFYKSMNVRDFFSVTSRSKGWTRTAWNLFSGKFLFLDRNPKHQCSARNVLKHTRNVAIKDATTRIRTILQPTTQSTNTANKTKQMGPKEQWRKTHTTVRKKNGRTQGSISNNIKTFSSNIQNMKIQ